MNNGWLLTSAGWVFDSSLTLKGVTGFRSNPAIAIPGKNFYAVAVDETGVFDKIRFFDQDSSYELSWTDTGTIGTIGAMAATPDGSALYISSTAGMGKINIGVTPPGTSVPLPVSNHRYNDFAFDLARNVIYGTSTAGTVDVISANDGSVAKEYLLPSGARPIGIDLSPDSSEIAIALNGLQAILFMEPQTGETIASVRPVIGDEGNIYYENQPFDVIYGRSGRLYSDGNPGSSDTDYLHVIDTSTHTWLAKSPYPNTLSTGAEFAITADNQYLYANETFSPNNIYVFDIRTDVVTKLYKGPHGPVYASRFTINPDGSKVFTSNGQVWTGIMSEQIGSFAAGKLIEFIPGKNVFALARTLQSGTSDEVLFFSASDYRMISTYTLASNDTILEMESAPDGSKLALSLASRKVLVLDLNAPQISILDGSGQMAFIEKPFSKPLKLKIQTILGGGISGQTVNFTAPASGPSATFVDTGTNVSSAITDASGVATSAMLTANNLEGSYVITATASGLAGPVNFQLFNTVQQIKTYTANGSSALPGTLLCDQSQPNCTNDTNPDADAAHRYAFGTYNFYTTHHDRNSIDNAGMPILSTVDYCDPGYPCPYDNAFWSGTQMVYGDGYPVADDIVAHELTHGVTQYESNLFYYYQSGAINESFSDIWGELYDQSNGQGTDTPAVKWLLGEDVNGIGAIRSMSNPPAYGDPDSISSLYYYVGEDDNGGVHTNSGVNNKAAFLLVDGGSLNGKTVAALGADKTLAIYYEAQANLLVSGSDYADLYQLLYQACVNLVGANGIAMADCQEVRNATDAVRMDQQPVNDPDYNRDAPLCPADAPKIDFLDDLENGSANWSLQTRWSYDSPYSPFAHSGEHYLYADGYPASISDTSAALKEITIPYNAYLHFSHAYSFESGYYNSQMYYFDGGVLEYSTDGGASWHDAGGMMDFNGYPGAIYAGWNNPLLGRPAFVGNANGYISTRVNLAPLAGSQAKFRWRMGLDDTGSSWGWWLDDVKVYTCGADTSFADVSNTYWAWSHIERLYSAGITGGCANNPLRYCPESTVTRAQMAIFLLRGIHGSAYTPPSVGDSTGFSDVPVSYWASAWIKQFYAEGITGGCGSGVYCPDQSVTRAQMAIFLLRAKYGSAYNPPSVDGATGFNDVPVDYWAAAWIKQLAAEGITSGCGNGNYCPENPVTRAQMAIFLVRAFGLP